MKKLLIILTVLYLAAGCNKLTTIGQNNSTSDNQEPLGLPSDIYPAQMGSEFVVEGKKYLLILQPNANYNIPLPSGQVVKWSGILSSSGDGLTWNKYFSIQDPTINDGNGPQIIKHNPVNIFAKDGNVFIDLVDSRGAGSGEGNLTRITSKDGKTWSKVGCYYFPGPNIAADPERYKTSNQCIYKI